MKVRRRLILKTGAFAIGALATTGCQKIITEIDERFGEGIPDRIQVSHSQFVDPDFHFLSRLSFGPGPSDLEHLKKIGQSAWLDSQLNYESIDDKLANLRTRRFESRFLSTGDCFDVKKEVLRKDIVRHTLLKSIYSKRQLLEVMVNFWNDHLNINIEKGNCVYFKTLDDMDVVRKNALGNFNDLIKASALSAAMLEYLDGKDNKKSSTTDVPNENYARELLELHTLGVDGGYTQKDVFEAARCLTGWRIKEGFGRGKVFFDPQFHDDGAKVVLGKVIPEHGGEKDLDRLLNIVCNHRSTSKHLAFKLAEYFVSSNPSPELVSTIAKEFHDTKGDIKSTLRVIINSKEFASSKGLKFKRPYRLIVSAIRALGASTFARDDLLEYLSRMGQEPFQYPTPDGFPTETLPWLGSLLWRWNYALALPANQIKSVKVEVPKLADAILGDRQKDSGPNLLFQHLVGRLPREKEEMTFAKFVSDKKGYGNQEDLIPELIGLILSSPAFQRF